jgi:tetratricopeptide (TPR) repeat protein
VQKVPDAITHLTDLLKTADERKSAYFSYRTRLMLACALTQVGDFKQAEKLFTQVLKEEEGYFGRQDRKTIGTLYLLGNSRLNLNDLPGAMACYAECRAWYQADKLRPDAKYPTLLNEYAHCHLRKGQYTEAADCFAEAATVRERLLPRQVLFNAELRYNAARAFHLAGDTDKSLTQIGPAVAGIRTGDAKSDLLPLALELNAALLSERKDHVAAEKLAAECVDLCAKHLPNTELHLLAKSGLGVALVGQGKFADAEPHHLDAVNGLTDLRTRAKQPLTDPQYLTVLRRVIDLYDGWEKPDELAKWKGRLPKGGK